MDQCIHEILTASAKQSFSLKKLRTLLKKQGSHVETSSQVMSCLEQLLFVRSTLPASVASAAHVLKEFSPITKIADLVAVGLTHWPRETPMTENQAAVVEAIVHAAPDGCLARLAETLWQRAFVSLSSYGANLGQNIEAFVQNVTAALTLLSSGMKPQAELGTKLLSVVQSSLLQDRQTTSHLLNSAFLWVRLGGSTSLSDIPQMSHSSRLAVIRGLVIQGDSQFTLDVLPTLLQYSMDNASMSNNQRFFLYRALGAAVDTLWKGFKKEKVRLDPSFVDTHLYPLLLLTSEDVSSGVVPKRDRQVDQLLQIIGGTTEDRTWLERYTVAMCEPKLLPGPLTYLVRRFGVDAFVQPDMILERALRSIDNKNAGKIKNLIGALIGLNLPWIASYLKVLEPPISDEDVQRVATYAFSPLVKIKGALLDLTHHLLDSGAILSGLLALKTCRMNSLINAEAMKALADLESYVVHLEPSVRLAAGWCIVSVRKQKSGVTPWECGVLRKFLVANLAHGFRHNFRRAVVEIMARFWKRSGVENEILWAEEVLLDALYPGCPSSKLNAAIDLYYQLPSRSPSKYSVGVLFQLLLSRQDRVREVAVSILNEWSPNLPGLEHDSLQGTFELLQSVHARDCDSASMQFCVLLPHLKGVELAVFPEIRATLTSTQMSNEDVAGQLVSCISQCLAKAESDFLYVARERPMHGMLKLLRKLMGSCTVAMLQPVLDLLPRITRLSLTVIGMEAAERDLGDSYEKVAAWRINKEVSLIVPILCQWGCDYEQSVTLGDMIFSTLYESKHRGVLENAYVALEKLCVMLLRSTDSQSSALPEKWLRTLLLEVRGAQDRKTNYIITRRSAGLPFGVVAVLRAERIASGLRDASPLLDFAIPELIDIASGPRDESLISFDQQRGYSNLVHSLNVLRMSIMDGCINEVTQQYVEEATLLALRGYHSNSWAIRNSSSLLFAATVRRFHDIISFTLFETRYAKLYQFILDDLSVVDSPTVFPILLLLEHIQRLKNHAKLLTKVESMLGHPHFLVRRKAAQVLAHLMPSADAKVWEIYVSGEAANQIHGRLMCAANLCKGGLLVVTSLPSHLLHSFCCPPVVSAALDVAYECKIDVRDVAQRVVEMGDEFRHLPMISCAKDSAKRILGISDTANTLDESGACDEDLAADLQDDDEDIRRRACESVGAGEESQCLALVFSRLDADVLFSYLMHFDDVPSHEVVDEKRVFEHETLSEFCDDAGACWQAYQTLVQRGSISEKERVLRRRCLVGLSKVQQLSRWDEQFVAFLGAILVVRLVNEQLAMDDEEKMMFQRIRLDQIKGIPPLLAKEWEKTKLNNEYTSF